MRLNFTRYFLLLSLTACGTVKVEDDLELGEWQLSSSSCTYQGVQHRAGDHFPSADGCNTCGCHANGSVVCTARACANDAGTNPSSCSGPSPTGCRTNGCAAGFTCDTSLGCFPSSCSCNNGQWVCTADCGGGTCVPQPRDAGTNPGQCTGPDPRGCASTGCATGYVCDTSQGCFPSSCACNAGQWTCTADCGGGTCVPKP
jgi:hypothetical protein